MCQTPGLQEDALGLTQSVAMGVAGAAPAYSLSATMAALIAAVGPFAAGSLVYGALVMFGIVLAYSHLNRVEANAGATYSWVSRIFSPTVGFLAGWALLVSSVLFMVSATLPAAAATLLLLKPELVADKLSVTLVAVGWLCAVTALVIRGVALAGAVQVLMTTAELTALALIVGLAAVKFGPRAVHQAATMLVAPPALDAESISQGLVIALFFFWGWDVALNLNEETRDGTRTPGRGALLAMLVITGIFVAFALIVLVALNDEEIRRAGTNIVFEVADRLLPRPWSYVAVLALMLSTVGTMETTIQQFSRTLFAQARDGLLPRRLSRLHPRWRTPYTSTLGIALLGVLMLLGVLLFPSITAALRSSIDAVSVQAAFYYGLAGLACAWHFRGRVGWPRSLAMVVWPAASALALWAAAVIAVRRFDGLTNAITFGSMAAGFLPLALQRHRFSR